MELVLNEISLTPLTDNKFTANERMLLFSRTVAEARKKGFRILRTHLSSSEIKLAEDYSLHHWLFDNQFPAEYRTLFYDMIVQPFINEGDVAAEEKFIEANYFFEDSTHTIPKQECLGLTSAWLCESLAISLQSNAAWLKNELNLIIERQEDTSIVQVPHVFSKECFNVGFIADFVESISILDLEETDINPEDKTFHCTSHHGQKELLDLWNRIKKSPFVKEGISIEWGGDAFFKKPQRDGKVDIVHLKSDRRYAMQIQTTGRNLRETIGIAKILAEKYE